MVQKSNYSKRHSSKSCITILCLCLFPIYLQRINILPVLFILISHLSYKYLIFFSNQQYVSQYSFIDIFLTIFPGGSDSKVSAYDVGDPGAIPGSGRSSGERNGNPLQYSCLEIPADGGAWQATVHGVAKSRTRLSG